MLPLLHPIIINLYYLEADPIARSLMASTVSLLGRVLYVIYESKFMLGIYGNAKKVGVWFKEWL